MKVKEKDLDKMIKELVKRKQKFIVCFHDEDRINIPDMPLWVRNRYVQIEIVK
mgnify:CR=1 FL=1